MLYTKDYFFRNCFESLKSYQILLLLALVITAGCSDLPPSRSPIELYRPRYLSSLKPKQTVNTTLATRKAKFDANAEVLSAKFTELSSGRGKWSGMIKGKGHVALKLLVFHNDQLVSSRYMGDVHLRGRPTPFIYESSVPELTDWKWQLVFTRPA